MTTVSIPELPFPLALDGSPECQHQLTDGTLVLTGAAGTDLFIDPAGNGPHPDACRLTGIPPEGDFAFGARVTVDFTSKFDAGVLLVHASDRYWAKLCFELSPQFRPTAVTVVTRQVSDDCNSFEVTGRALWLRVIRVGRAWAFHASADGQWWRLLRYFALGDTHQHGAMVRIGFLAQSPAGGGCTAIFDHIAFSPAVPADLRDGS